MNEWELTDKKRSEIRTTLICLEPTHCADRDIAMIKSGEKNAQRTLVEWIEKEIVAYANGNLYACGLNASMKWQELRKGVGLE